MVITVTDFHAPELDVYARLNERELIHLYDPQEGLFIAESPNVILRALNAGLWREVREVLNVNRAERHLRGGAATREKYRLRRERMRPGPGN